MWMHGPSLVCLTLALAARAARTPLGCVVLRARCDARSRLLRATDEIVPLLVFAVWVALQGRRPVVRYAVRRRARWQPRSWCWISSSTGGRCSHTSAASRLGLSATTVEALLGNLVSPAPRAPRVRPREPLLRRTASYLKRRAGTLTPLDVAVATSAVGYWLLVSTFPSWWAGWSYGPRFLTDIAPMVIWFLPPVLAEIVDRRRLVLGALLAVTIALSVSIQAHGALSQSTAEWNWKPVDVGLDRGRLWDWSDPQFLR